MAGYNLEESPIVDELTIDCPYCGETIDILVDNSAGEQEYFEDCPICCAPILLVISIDRLNNIQLVAKRDNE